MKALEERIKRYEDLCAKLDAQRLSSELSDQDLLDALTQLANAAANLHIALAELTKDGLIPAHSPHRPNLYLVRDERKESDEM